MFHIGRDLEGKEIGWAQVLDYIGVGWTPESLEEDLEKQRQKEEKKARLLTKKMMAEAQTKLEGVLP